MDKTHISTILKVLAVSALIGVAVYICTVSILKGILALAATLVLAWLGYKFIDFAGSALESGFRNQFPDDFILALDWITSYFFNKRFRLVRKIDRGTDHPGVVLSDGKDKITIRLNAPLNDSVYSVDVYLNDEPQPKWHFPDEVDHSGAYIELDKYFGEKDIHSDKPTMSVRLTNYYNAMSDDVDNTKS